MISGKLSHSAWFRNVRKSIDNLQSSANVNNSSIQNTIWCIISQWNNLGMCENHGCRPYLMAIFNGDHDLSSQILGFFHGFGDPEPMNGNPIELKCVRTGTVVTWNHMKPVSIRKSPWLVGVPMDFIDVWWCEPARTMKMSWIFQLANDLMKQGGAPKSFFGNIHMKINS